MNLRDLLDAIAEIHIVQGGLLPVLAEEGQELVSVEYNDDDGPCVLLIFEEPAPDVLTVGQFVESISRREP